MSEKRALIVDDSKSARVVLSRMLEKYDLAVDTSDSAEHALEYLKAHRPDVIFMDHLMPGMDGLAAVQAIRSNPETASIPIMMYTSQEGELYLGQARALGATGVLPKRIGSTEVSRILQDLRLLDVPVEGGAPVGPTAAGPLSGPIVVASAGTAEAAAPAPAPASTAADVPGTSVSASGAAAAPVAATAALPTAPAPAVHVIAVEDLQRVLEPLLKQHSADLRRFVVASLDSFAARVVTETREAPRPVAVEAAASPPPAATSAPGSAAASVPMPAPAEAGPTARPTAWIAVAAVASVAALTAGAFAFYQQRQIDTLAAALAAPSRAALVAAPAPAAGPASPVAEQPADGVVPPSGEASDGSAPVAAPSPAIAPAAFAYGALPFADAGLERLAAVLAELEQRGARGVLTATLHAGDFCLTGNPTEGYALAPDEMPADRCDVVGNPHYDGLRAAQRQGAGYADLVAALRARTAGALDVRVVDAGRQGAVAAYPSGGGASAQQWNAAAAANQRIEFAFAPSAATAGAAP